MEENRLSFLLEKVMAGEASSIEHREMVHLLARPELKEPALDLLLEAYFEDKPVQDLAMETRDQILTAIFSAEDKLEKAPAKMHFRPWKWMIAAALFLAVCAIGIRLYLISDTTPPTEVAKTKHDVKPGKNQATLTLADGSIVALDSIHTGSIAQQAGLIITKQKDGTLLYEVANQNKLGDGTNTISTPMGGKYTVVLADKTTITLNSASSITYPLSFTETDRRVLLKGEAYFEVAKDKHRPFIVSTHSSAGVSSQDVEVLGTHFNINAYADDNSYVTTLLEGSIKISTKANPIGEVLSPGEQATVRKDISIVRTSTEAAVAWKDDIFYFSNESIENLMKRIARWYNVDVEFKGPSPKMGFWGQISMKKTLSEVLQSLEDTGQVQFELTGRKVVVSE